MKKHKCNVRKRAAIRNVTTGGMCIYQNSVKDYLTLISVVKFFL